VYQVAHQVARYDVEQLGRDLVNVEDLDVVEDLAEDLAEDLRVVELHGAGPCSM